MLSIVAHDEILDHCGREESAFLIPFSIARVVALPMMHCETDNGLPKDN